MEFIEKGIVLNLPLNHFISLYILRTLQSWTINNRFYRIWHKQLLDIICLILKLNSLSSVIFIDRALRNIWACVLHTIFIRSSPLMLLLYKITSKNFYLSQITRFSSYCKSCIVDFWTLFVNRPYSVVFRLIFFNTFENFLILILSWYENRLQWRKYTFREIILILRNFALSKWISTGIVFAALRRYNESATKLVSSRFSK